jgi:hypothetical protein
MLSSIYFHIVELNSMPIILYAIEMAFKQGENKNRSNSTLWKYKEFIESIGALYRRPAGTLNIFLNLIFPRLTPWAT